jgi:predicted DNA-binding protein YlxM (UPF0122 family)
VGKDFSILGLFDLYGPTLSDRQNEVLKSYYEYDLSLGEIADNLGVSRQAVMDALRKGTDALKSAEKKLGFYQRIQNWNRQAAAVQAAVGEGRAADAAALLETMRSER